MEVFPELKTRLMRRLDKVWESTDEEILDLIDEILMESGREFGLNLKQKTMLRKELFCSIRKLDVLQELLEDEEITEIMVNGWKNIFIEKEGRIFPWKKSFTSREKLDDVIQQIAGRCNRVINTLHPIVDARLDNGARVNAVIPPAAVDGPVLTIRQFPEESITMKKLCQTGSISAEAGEFLEQLVKAKYNLLIGGGTGAGKTTFLNALSAFIPGDERIITIEDNAELRLQGLQNLVRLECRKANTEETQEISTRTLLRTALRMRPDRIVVGEIREEAEELLQAVNVGSEGSMSTIHANSCQDMVTRLETMALMEMNIPLSAVKRQILSGFDIFIHLGRLRDKSRKVLEICEVDTIENNEIRLNPLFSYREEKGFVKIGSLKHREKLERAGIKLEDRL